MCVVCIHPEGESCWRAQSRFECSLSMTLVAGVAALIMACLEHKAVERPTFGRVVDSLAWPPSRWFHLSPQRTSSYCRNRKSREKHFRVYEEAPGFGPRVKSKYCRVSLQSA